MSTEHQWTLSSIFDRIHAVTGKRACEWQLEGALAQMDGKDVVVTAPTGLGKTLVFTIPLILDPERIIIIITPLIQLGTQHAESFQSYGIPAIALDHSTNTRENIEAVGRGEYRAIITSPELFSSKSFQQVLNSSSSTLKNNARTLVIDEVHTMNEWSNFRQEFLTVPYIRNQFRNMQVYATTATITPHDLKELKYKLQMDPDSTVVIQRCNDRPNIKWLALPFRSSRSSFQDLSFLIPTDTSDSKPPPRALVFTESCNEAELAAGWLKKRLKKELRQKVRWVTAKLSTEGRKAAMDDFAAGRVWIVVCTDAVGMGIDIPDINVVVQYGTPTSLTSLFQRMGRGARNLQLETLAIILYDPKHLPESHRPPPKRKKCSDDNSRPRKSATISSKSHQLASSQCTRGNVPESNGDQSSDDSESGDDLPKKTSSGKRRRLQKERAMDVSLLQFLTPVNATSAAPPSCRLAVTYRYFGNDKLKKPKHCCSRCKPASLNDGKCGRCDICIPSIVEDFLERLDPLPPRPKRLAVPRKPADPEKESMLRQKLVEWRNSKSKQAGSVIGPTRYLSNSHLQRILDMSRHPIGSPDDLQDFATRIPWSGTDIYGAELLPIIQSVYPPRSTIKVEKIEDGSQEQMPQPQPSSSRKTDKPKAPVRCGRCGETGHIKTSVLKCRLHPKRLEMMIKEETDDMHLLTPLNNDTCSKETVLMPDLLQDPMIVTESSIPNHQLLLFPHAPLPLLTNQSLNMPPPTGPDFTNQLYQQPYSIQPAPLPLLSEPVTPSTSMVFQPVAAPFHQFYPAPSFDRYPPVPSTASLSQFSAPTPPLSNHSRLLQPYQDQSMLSWPQFHQD